MKALVIVLIVLGSFDWKVNGKECKGIHFWLNMIALALFCIFFAYKG